MPPGTDQVALELPEIVESIGEQRMAELPPGIVLDSDAIDELITSSTANAPNAPSAESALLKGMRNVKIVEEDMVSFTSV